MAAIVWMLISAAIVRYLTKRLSPTTSNAPEPTMDENVATSFYGSDRYTPSVEDVLSTKETLFQAFKLPVELIDTIIEFAEYYPCTSVCRTSGELHVRSGGAGVGGSTEDRFLVRSLPLGYIPGKSSTIECPMDSSSAIPLSYPTIPASPWRESDALPGDITEDLKKRWASASQMKGESPCRKIVFTIVSHDQGWGGASEHKGTFKGSFTWFDVGKERIHVSHDKSAIDLEQKPGAFPTTLPLQSSPESTEEKTPMACTVETLSPSTNPNSQDRFEHPLLPTLECLQKNRTSTRKAEEYKIEWSCHDAVDPDSLDGKALEEQGRGRNTANGRFVRDMRVGDVVTVWGKARFPGWVNMIEMVKIDVFWAV
ncbi:hypothetical protein VTL71DRAFT_6535 [Oculimacula yallundae]|uniref:Uncharacterized protein n=1 Tax=Oculimacula yallundae TaxID=86028 RepID=A0ABR4BYX8_9HELO